MTLREPYMSVFINIFIIFIIIWGYCIKICIITGNVTWQFQIGVAVLILLSGWTTNPFVDAFANV